ncbi:GGDEF domain-containing protein [Tundrisphaera lichenicola]|uniref:GGDEF domain-containing protein n=1 Tax=Tundrisphaera lichenicola TaxID=2029860 RepID=UPI003EBD7F62
MKILVVEDHPCDALILRRILERQGHQVTVVTDGLEAWEKLQVDRYSLVISDWVMPGLDGLELCRRLREQENWPYIYLILLTSRQSRDERYQGLAAGADDFLTKPPNAKELAIRLRIASRIITVQEELERRNDQLAELANSDELTGLQNRRKFHELIRAHALMAEQQDLPLSLVMLDVDNFKSYNDDYGHPAGDFALRGVALVLREGVRKHDEIGRVGGEEFAILLPDTDAELARELANRLRKAMIGHEWPLRPLTASFGVATVRKRHATSSELFDKADRALYHSKRQGRNQVTHFLDLPESSDSAGIAIDQIGVKS